MASWRKIRLDTALLIGALAIIILYTVISTGAGLIRLYRPMQQQEAPTATQVVPTQPQSQRAIPEQSAPAQAPVVPPAAKPVPKQSKPVDDIPMQRQPPAPESKPRTTVAARSGRLPILQLSSGMITNLNRLRGNT